MEPWQAEVTAPTKLARAGWTKHTFKAGDPITVTGPVSKAAKHSLWVQKLIGPDGHPLRLRETASAEQVQLAMFQRQSGGKHR